MMKLNYTLPSGAVHQIAFHDMESEYYLAWLESMVKMAPDTIFFYTVDSTDIWEKEWDFNEVVTKMIEERYVRGLEYDKIYLKTDGSGHIGRRKS